MIESEAKIRQHRKSLFDDKSSTEWLAGTFATYDATGLRKLYLDSLVDSDRESGFSSLPLGRASVS